MHFALYLPKPSAQLLPPYLNPDIIDGISHLAMSCHANGYWGKSDPTEAQVFAEYILVSNITFQ